MAQFPTYELAVEAYEGMVMLRHQRDDVKKDLANSWRKRNEDGNIWYSGQFRPTYTQEAVADLASVLDAFNVNTTIFWENQWRRGDDKHWNELTTHTDLPKFNPRDSYTVLRQLGWQQYEQYEQLRKDLEAAKQRVDQIHAEHQPVESQQPSA